MIGQNSDRFRLAITVFDIEEEAGYVARFCIKREKELMEFLLEELKEIPVNVSVTVTPEQTILEIGEQKRYFSHEPEPEWRKLLRKYCVKDGYLHRRRFLTDSFYYCLILTSTGTELMISPLLEGAYRDVTKECIVMTSEGSPNAFYLADQDAHKYVRCDDVSIRNTLACIDLPQIGSFKKNGPGTVQSFDE